MSFRLLPLALLLLASACGPRPPSPPSHADQAAARGILLRGNKVEPESLDPHLATSVSAGNILLNLFEGLTRLDPASLEPEPALAEHWDISDDGLRISFHLRPSQWSDGHPLRASDFVFAWRRLLDPRIAASYAFMLHPLRNARAVNRGDLPPEQLGVSAPDDHTLVLTLEHPTPWILPLLAHWVAFPLPEHVLRPLGADHNRETLWTRPESIVSNGPFLLDTWTPQVRVHLLRNPLYWQASLVSLQGADFLPIENQETEERAFRGGNLHLTYTLPRHRIHAWRQQAPASLRIDPYLESVGWVINLRSPGLSNPLVRQALSLALDRRLLVDNVLQGVRPPAFSLVPPGTAGYQPGLLLQENPDLARRLLAEAGFPNGEGLPEFRLVFVAGQDATRVAEVIQRLWFERLGVRLRLENLERQTYFQRRSEGDFDLLHFAWVGDFIDPETFLGLWRSDAGNNFARWNSPPFDAAMAASATLSPTRMEHLRRAEALLLEDLPILPLYFGATQFLASPHVQGWHPNLLDQHPLRSVTLLPPSSP